MKILVRGRGRGRGYQYIDLAKPKSGVCVGLFSSPSLHWIKTVRNSSAPAVENFLQSNFGTSPGVGKGGRIDQVWNLGTTFSQHLCSWGPSLLFLMFWRNFRRWGMFSSSDEVCDVSISWNYILLSMTHKFGLWKWARIEKTTVNYFVLRKLLVMTASPTVFL